MNHSIKSAFQTYARLFVLAMLPAFSAFTTVPESPKPALAVCTCATPQVAKTGQAPGSITFAWSPVNGATEYQVWYVRKSDNHMSSPSTTTATSHTFSGLTAGYYTFYFVAVCGNESSGYVIIEDLVM
ncbi:MAG: hypothetical protein JNJ57_19680 [Saprospiraceae bacterium]|nr:hypothetical protein [Saprospiraceae bacterium]